MKQPKELSERWVIRGHAEIRTVNGDWIAEFCMRECYSRVIGHTKRMHEREPIIAQAIVDSHNNALKTLESVDEILAKTYE